MRNHRNHYFVEHKVYSNYTHNYIHNYTFYIPLSFLNLNIYYVKVPEWLMN